MTTLSTSPSPFSRGRLILGEAKNASGLDGSTRASRIRDARKLITAGELFGASEIWYAISEAWKQATKDATLAAVNESATLLTSLSPRTLPMSGLQLVPWSPIQRVRDDRCESAAVRPLRPPVVVVVTLPSSNLTSYGFGVSQRGRPHLGLPDRVVTRGTATVAMHNSTTRPST